MVFDTGVFRDEYKAWSKLEEANQTWENFCRMFAQSRIDLQERSGTARSAGCANNVQQDTECLEAITNLANAATEDRSVIATLANLNIKYHQ